MTIRERAQKLREKGYSYSYIAEKTGLSKSTLSYYLHDVPYTPNGSTIKAIGKARAQSGYTKAKMKQESYAKAEQLAQKDIGQLTSRDIFMLGLGVYIGEGSKTQDIIRVVNSDYRVIKLFIRWLCDVGYTAKHFTIRIHLYPDSNILESVAFWSQKTGIPKTQFQRPYIDKRIHKDMRRVGKHIYGTAHVTVRSNGTKDLGVLFSRRIGAWMEKVLE